MKNTLKFNIEGGKVWCKVWDCCTSGFFNWDDNDSYNVRAKVCSDHTNHNPVERWRFGFGDYMVSYFSSSYDGGSSNYDWLDGTVWNSNGGQWILQEGDVIEEIGG